MVCQALRTKGTRDKKEDVEGFVKIVSVRNQVDRILGGQLNV